MVALVGDSFSGKSLLMKALSAPHDLTDLEVQGLVQLNGLQPWDRNTEVQAAAAVYLPPRPLIIPDSGQANLMHPTGEMARRAEYLLKSLLHNADTTQRILNCRNATQLSHSEQKALGFVRAVCLRPSLYLLDRPEDGCPEMLRSTLLTRLRDEVRRGATVLVATEDRAMLEACDQLINLQNGRLVEMAPAAEMRARASAGWQRFVAPCELESEDALDSWINAQFRRDGDGANRRAVCMVANEMLTLACRTDMPSAIQSVCFEIKLFAGQCVLRMRQAQPLSSGALERAATQARGDAPLTDTPLARIVRDSLSVENTRPDNQHWLEVAIAIYDPRKANNTPPSAEAKPDAQTAD
jgi:ABC-type multidrug transport system ATPase subunit